MSPQTEFFRSDDIFSDGFRLLPEYIEVVDFNQTIYCLDYVTGESSLR